MKELIDALRTMNELNDFGDAIYNVRERAFDAEPFDGNSWDHPRVKRYSDACQVVMGYIRDKSL